MRGRMFERFKKFTALPLFFSNTEKKSLCAGSRISKERSLKKCNRNELLYIFTIKLSAGIHLGPSSSRERSLEGFVGVVTGCHAGSLEGQRHPEELSQLVGHLPASYGGGLLAVVFAIHL